MLDVRRLRLLRELSRRGTIAAVARALSYSPSAVSQQLSVLEREAGVRLLEPVGRRLRLTPEGELLVTHADSVLAELDRAEADLASALGEVRGTARVAAFQSALLALVPRALTTLTEAHPDLRVEVTELEPEQSVPALLAGDFDVVLGEEFPGHPLALTPGVERTDLVEDELHLVTPTGWGTSRLADLTDRPFALEPLGSASRQWAVTVCRSAGVEPDVRYTSADLQVHLRMVESGLAAALLPGLAGPQGREGVTVGALPGRPRRRVLACTREGTLGRPALTAVVDALHAA